MQIVMIITRWGNQGEQDVKKGLRPWHGISGHHRPWKYVRRSGVLLPGHKGGHQAYHRLRDVYRTRQQNG